MASLVADYGTSSNSDSDQDDETQFTQSSIREENASRKPINYLSGDLEQESSSDSENELENSEEQRTPNRSHPNTLLEERLPKPLLADKLPSASFLGSQTEGKLTEASVFLNPFLKAEVAKHSILEQHVKMTSTEIQKAAGGKKICWNFRKGKCHFGHKCKYSHGMELVTGSGETSQDLPHNNAHYGQNTWNDTSTVDDQDDKEEDGYMAEMKRKRRAGITDTYVPPKKAMKPYTKMRAEERPWTLEKHGVNH